MPWTSLGVVTVGENWQEFDQPVLGSDAIRLIHTTSLQNNYCIGFVAPYFNLPAPGGRLSPWRRIYSGPEPSILDLAIPDSFKEANLTVFYLQIKARWPYHLVSWQVEAQAFY